MFPLVAVTSLLDFIWNLEDLLMGTPEFLHLGKHCSVDHCRQIDFLPFTCDRCSKVFCLQHRSCTNHRCLNANQSDVTVVICPLCAKGVRLVLDEDPNITWELHVNIECDTSNYQRATRKRHCPSPGCKEVLNLSNSVRCRDCTQEHCLKHRFGTDHNCVGPKKPESGFRFIGLLSKSQKGKPPQDSRSNSSWWGTNIMNAISNVRASAEASLLKFGNTTTQALQKVKDGIAESSSSGDLGEQCVLCRAWFSTVSALIDHVERYHHQNSQPGRVTIDICPICSKEFGDPVALVEHVERDHGKI